MRSVLVFNGTADSQMTAVIGGTTVTLAIVGGFGLNASTDSARE